MSEFSPLTEQDLPAPIHLEQVLDELQIEYLDVDDQRLYIIYAETVLEVQVHSGTLDTAQTLSIAVVEEPDQPDADLESIVGVFLGLLEDAADATGPAGETTASVADTTDQQSEMTDDGELGDFDSGTADSSEGTSQR